MKASYCQHYVAAVLEVLETAWQVHNPFTRYAGKNLATVKIPSAYGCNDSGYFSLIRSMSLRREDLAFNRQLA